MTQRLSLIEQDTIDRLKEEFYGVESGKLHKLVLLRQRLYSERTMGGDEMRDWAHTLDGLLEEAMDFPITEEDTQ